VLKHIEQHKMIHSHRVL